MASRSGTSPQATSPQQRWHGVSLGIALAAVFTLISALAFASPAVALEQKLTASDGAAGDRLGDSVAIDGDTLAIGAPYRNDGRGAIYLYQRVGDGWANSATLTASDGARNANLGVSVAISGDTIVAGAPYAKVGDNLVQGSVYTFARTGEAARTETAKLTASDGAAGDALGLSVAIDGDTIVAGASEDRVGDIGTQGSVYTFARTGEAARTETAKLTASDGARSDHLGYSVAIDGDTIVAGANGDDVGDIVSQNQGSVYAFASTGEPIRNETAKLTATDTAIGDQLGHSVAIDGDTIAAGAPTINGRGSVYTFARTGAATRNETAKLTTSDGAEGDFFGGSVAIDGDTIAAGASNDDVGSKLDQGSAYTFARIGAATRTETAKLTASDGAQSDILGSVAIDGDTIVAGASGDDVGDDADQGSASVFFSATDSDSDGVPDSSDACPVVPAGTASGCPSVPRALTLSYSTSKEAFRGVLSASEPACVSRDLVTVWKRIAGADERVGADAVNGRGRYVVPKRERPGRYYSTVDERIVPGVAACGSATSPILRLP